MSVYIIAEAGVNHNGSLDRALALIDAAADAGTDAVKFQTFSAEKLALGSAPKANYQKRLTDPEESQQSMLAALELDQVSHERLRDKARNRGIDFLSSPFDPESLEMLVGLGVPSLKVPSGELTNLPLIWEFGRVGLPLLLSTGMATLEEVKMALATAAHARVFASPPASTADLTSVWDKHEIDDLSGITLLHCTSRYPAPLNEVNLTAMDTLARTFGLPVGYSDHTEGSLIPVAAVARGAVVIEKHLTMDRSLSGPDHQASLEPDEFNMMVKNIRALELALGDGIKAPQPSEAETARVARQRLIASQPIVAGDVFTKKNLTTARTGGGRLASEYWDLIGTPATQSYHSGEVIK